MKRWMLGCVSAVGACVLVAALAVGSRPADAGGLYVLGTFGGFTIGDRVRVTGEVDPFCFTFCQQGNGCILNNTIESCDIALLGRCCFLGIVPEPILCAETTEAECEQYAAPISWTPGIGCDVPCEQDEFSGCGELAIGPQGCILLLADSGEI